MGNNKPSLYCCCINQQPPRFSSIAPLVPIMAGAVYMTQQEKEEYKKCNFIMDDDGENISCLNPWFGDLTVLYWTWKNTREPFVGVCQYRRPWMEDSLTASVDGVLYVPPPAFFGSVEQQYLDCHSIFNAPLFTRELARQNKIPLSLEMVDSAWRQQKFYGCNMARGPRELFDKYCDLVFAIMMPLWEEHKELCRSISGYQSRTIAFTAERMITALILNGEYFFGKNIIQEAPIGFIP